MIIRREYMLEKPARPSAPKYFLDTKVVPLVVNMTGTMEVAVSRASARTGVRPWVILAGAGGLASLAVALLLRNRHAASER
jgi:hypothetical protein